MADPILRAAWPNGNSGSALIRTGLRVRSQHETGYIAALTDPGAPVAPRLVGKSIWTSLMSVAGFAVLIAFADYAG